MVGFGTVGLSAGGVVERGVAEGAVGDALVAITVKDLSPPVFVAGGTGSGGRHGGYPPLPWVWRSPPGFGPPQGASYSLYHWYHNTPLHRENHVIGFTSFNRSDGKYKGLPPSYPTGFILPR